MAYKMSKRVNNFTTLTWLNVIHEYIKSVNGSILIFSFFTNEYYYGQRYKWK